MTTDFDTPRTRPDEAADDTLLTLNVRSQQGAVIDLDETDLADSYELPGGDLSGEELQLEILPAQADEFTCSSCFLVRHRSQMAREKGELKFCRDCEG